METLLSQIYSSKEKIKNARVNGVNLRSTVSKAFSNPNLGGSKYQMDSSGKPYYVNECGYALPVGDASGNTDNNFTIPSITGNNNDNAETIEDLSELLEFQMKRLDGIQKASKLLFKRHQLGC